MRPAAPASTETTTASARVGNASEVTRGRPAALRRGSLAAVRAAPTAIATASHCSPCALREAKNDLAAVERLRVPARSSALHATQPHQAHEGLGGKPVLVALGAERGLEILRL